MAWSSIEDESGLLAVGGPGLEIYLSLSLWPLTQFSLLSVPSPQIQGRAGPLQSLWPPIIGPLQVTGLRSGDSEPQFPLIFSSQISYVALAALELTEMYLSLFHKC